MKVATLILVTLLTGCSGQSVQGVIDSLQFEEGETGCARFETRITGRFTSTDVEAVLVKKTDPTVPDC